jgi:outer membrane receptor protein involved in Fe transport
MKTILFGAAASAVLAAAMPAFANDAAASEVDELIVTARAGAEQRKVEASYAITTISEERLRMQSPVSTAEALKNVPGFWVEASGGEAGANIRARGIPMEGYSAIGMQEDGAPIQHDGGLGFLNSDFSFRMDETIQRLEVVRGGPSSIFTSYAPGGVVNFITRKGSDQFEGLVKAQVGDYGLARGDFWVGGPVAGFRVGLGGFYRVSDGVRDPGYRADEGGQIRLSVGRDFERGSIDFNIKHLDDNTIFFLGVPLTFDSNGDTAGVPGFDPNHGTFAGPETSRFTFRTNRGPYDFDLTRGADVQLTQSTLAFRYELGAGWELQDNLRYRTSDVSRAGLFPNSPVQAADRLAQVRAGLPSALGATAVQLRFANAPGETFDVAGQNGTGLIMDASMRQQDIALDEWINDFRLLNRFEFGGQSHDIALGLYYAKVEESFFQIGASALVDVQDQARLLNLVALNAAGQVVANITENGISRYGLQFNNAEGESNSIALYASDEWRLNDKLRIDLGFRWERIEMSGRNERSATVNLGQSASLADDQVLSGTGVFDPLDRDFDGWGATAGVNYQFAPDLGVFARYTRGFRLPSLGDFLTNPTRTDPRSQGIDLAEAGFKIDRPRFSVYATAFYTGFDSQSFSETRFDTATNTFVSRTEFTSTTSYGVELEGTVRPTEWFDVSFTGTAQDPRFGDFKFNTNVGGVLVPTDYSNNVQVRAPKVSGRVTPGLNLLDGKLRLEGDLQYYGKRFSDAANSLIIPDYFLLNAQVRYNITDDLTIYGYGTNLTNEIGLTEGNPRAGQFVSGEAGAKYYLGRPELGRAFRMAVLYRF